MTRPQARDDRYCAAIEQVKQLLAKFRPDATALKGNAVLSPRILALLLDQSESQIPIDVLGRLRPAVEAVLIRSELGIAEMVGEPVPEDVKSEIRAEAEVAYDSLAKLHGEVLKRA